MRADRVLPCVCLEIARTVQDWSRCVIPRISPAVRVRHRVRRGSCLPPAAVEYVVQWGLEHRELGTIRAIGVDEIAYGKGHQYLTLVYQIEAGCVRLLWVGQERTKESFELFFTLIGKELAKKIEFVCSDMWKPYLDLIAKHCPKALNILDRFHVVAKMNAALDEVRAIEARRMIQDGYQPVLKKSRWCLLKRPNNLTDNQRLKLRDVLRYNLKSVRAYLLKEEFQYFWGYDSPTWAGKFLDRWCTDVMRSRIEPMKNSPARCAPTGNFWSTTSGHERSSPAVLSRDSTTKLKSL